jgi:hypothetical protein
MQVARCKLQVVKITLANSINKCCVMKSYMDSEIYEKSRVLAIEVHKVSLLLPKFELYEEGSQLRDLQRR